MEPVKGDVGDVAHFGWPPDLHPLLRLLAAAGDLIHLLAAATAAAGPNVHGGDQIRFPATPRAYEGP
jgi:hypothetical protein